MKLIPSCLMRNNSYKTEIKNKVYYGYIFFFYFIRYYYYYYLLYAISYASHTFYANYLGLFRKCYTNLYVQILKTVHGYSEISELEIN